MMATVVRVDVFGILSPCQIAMLDGGFGRIIECVTFDDPSYDLMKFHLILRYVHELYTSVQLNQAVSRF